MANISQFQSSCDMRFMICDFACMYIPTGLKAISMEAAVAIMNIVISRFGTLAI